MPISISKTASCLLIILCALALAAQTTPPTATAAIQTVGTNPAAKNPTAIATTTTTTTTTTTKKSVTHHAKREIGANKPATYSAATRLASLLADTQDNATLSADAWKKIAGEATGLAGTISRSAKGSADVKHASIDLGTHIHEMHEAAMKGDAAGAKAHAGMALPFAYKLIDWSAPAK